MDAIKLLKEDHDKVKGYFKQVKNTESKDEKKQLYKKIREEIDVHTHIEEQIFYPTIRKKEGLEDIVKEGVQEHHQADLFIREIDDLVDDSEKFEPKLKVVMESVEHHIKEEEKEMFPKVREKFSETELNELGEKMKAEKKDFRKSYTASA